MSKIYKLLKLSFCVCLAFYITACIRSCNTEKKQENAILKIGTNANYPPFETVNKNGQLEGFDIDLGNLLAEKLDKKADFQELDFDALILSLNKGQIDIAISGLSITSSRQKEIFMVPYQGTPIKTISLLFWKNAPNNINNLDDLQNFAKEQKLPINVQAGHFLENLLKEQKLNIKTLSGPPEQILDLKYQKSLAAALDEKNAKTLVNSHSELNLLVLDLPEDSWDLGTGIGINKSNNELKDKISKAINEMKQDGTILKLEKKWLGEVAK